VINMTKNMYQKREERQEINNKKEIVSKNKYI